MRKIFLAVGLLSLLTLGGCASAPQESEAPKQQWFMDPSVEFGHYRTFGFLQVTAIRYQDPMQPQDKLKPGFFNEVFSVFGHHKKEKRMPIHHTDELIWRVLADEMAAKGYTQVAPQDADLLVIYYGGPRPQTPPEGVKIEPHTFDKYFAQNELKPQTFFIDVLDAKQGTLIYRGWDNFTFVKNDPDPQRVIDATTATISFFPSKK